MSMDLLRNGKLEESRNAANQSLTMTKNLFSPLHQDTINALALIALADAKVAARRSRKTKLKILWPSHRSSSAPTRNG